LNGVRYFFVEDAAYFDRDGYMREHRNYPDNRSGTQSSAGGD